MLAFITNEDRALAERTLDLIPKDVPQARILFEGSRDAVAMSSLGRSIKDCGLGRARPWYRPWPARRP